MQETHQDLCDIVSALEKQLATAVRSLMQSHVPCFNRYMNSQQASDKASGEKRGDK